MRPRERARISPLGCGEEAARWRVGMRARTCLSWRAAAPAMTLRAILAWAWKVVGSGGDEVVASLSQSPQWSSTCFITGSSEVEGLSLYLLARIAPMAARMSLSRDGESPNLGVPHR